MLDRKISDKIALSKIDVISGNGIRATQSIVAGNTIYRIENPLIAMPDNNHLVECCYRCLLWTPKQSRGMTSMQSAYTNAELSFCKGCTVVRYCSKTCQKADWKNGHKLECSIYKRILPRILPDSVRMVLRLLLMHKAGYFSPTEWEAILNMEGHVTDFKNAGGTTWEKIMVMSMGATGYAETIPGEQVLEIYCKFLINCFTATSQAFDSLGIAFDPVVAQLNHSCFPNTILIFDKRSVLLRALENIGVGEELVISYIDITNPTWYRQKELEERYFFRCQCSACTNPQNQVPNDESVRNLFTEGIYEALQNDGALTGANNSETEDRIQTMIVTHTSLLRKIRRKVPDVQLAVQPISALHYSIGQAHIALKDWRQAFLHRAVLYVKADPTMFRTTFHPIRVCRNFTLAMILLELSATSPESFDLDYTKVLYGLLVEVEGNLDKSYGRNSSFAELVRRKIREVETDIGIDGGPEVKRWLSRNLTQIPALDVEVGKLRKLVDIFIHEFYAD